MTMHLGRAGQPQPIESVRPADHFATDGLLDLLPAAVYLAQPGATGQWLYASPQIETILGFAAEDFIADSALWHCQVHPADRDRVLDAEADERYTVSSKQEYRMLRKDGRLVWVLDEARLAKSERYGTVLHGLLYEITERKRTEQLLAEQAQILAQLAGGGAVREVLVELAAATESVSGACRCVISVESDPPRTFTAEGPLEKSRLRQLGPAVHRAPFLAADGEQLGEVSLHYPNGPVQPQDVGLAEWSAGLATVTVQRETQQARFTTSMSLLQATLDSTADGIAVVSLNGGIVGYNQKFVDMWVLDPEQIDATGSDYIVTAIRSQLCDPVGVRKATELLQADPTGRSYDELHFLDGRIFERFYQPQLIEERPVGRVWSFRVT